MSHIATVEVRIQDLDALRSAAIRCGLEFREGQTHFRWFGGSDRPSEGYVSNVVNREHAVELGECQHAIGLPGNNRAYEIGVAAAVDGNGYQLLYDAYEGGYGLMKAVSSESNPNGIGRLVQAYSVEVATKAMASQGWRVQENTAENGVMELVCVR